jgi:hypothetical protein
MPNMRRAIAVVDQIPGALFVAGATVVLGLLHGARLVAQLRRNPGAVELAAILFTAGFVVLVIFAVRRRQTNVWTTAVQVIAAILGSNLLGLFVVWPFLPSGLPVSLASTAWYGLANGVTGAFVGLPLGAGALWLSRHWGAGSALTERRARTGLRPRRRAEWWPAASWERMGPLQRHGFLEAAEGRSSAAPTTPPEDSELDVTRRPRGESFS